MSQKLISFCSVHFSCGCVIRFSSGVYQDYRCLIRTFSFLSCYDFVYYDAGRLHMIHHANLCDFDHGCGHGRDADRSSSSPSFQI